MSKPKVIIAEDNPKLLAALRIQLAGQGFEVFPCADAYTALARAQDVRPDVMVLDIRMPAGNGFTILERMRRLTHLSTIPVIYITGEQAGDLEAKAYNLGAFALLRKPFGFGDLLHLVQTAIASPAQRGAKAPSKVYQITTASNPFDTTGDN